MHLCRVIAACVLFALMCFGAVLPANAAVLTDDLEVLLIGGVSTNWQTVPLENSYTSAIPICNYNPVSYTHLTLPTNREV